MKIVVAIDSFKGSLSSLQAGNAVKEAVGRLSDNAEVIIKPLADGGEGTVEALAQLLVLVSLSKMLLKKVVEDSLLGLEVVQQMMAERVC